MLLFSRSRCGVEEYDWTGEVVSFLTESSSSVVSHSMGCLNCLTASICLFYKERISNEMF
jgi:hypothetical protein